VFIQVFQGRVESPETVYVELDQWVKEIAPGTHGWLRSAAGVTGDNRFVGLALWESERAAREHGARPEQERWMSAFSQLFPQPMTTLESADVVARMSGDPEHARFVQVMHRRVSDPARVHALMGSHLSQWTAFRPEIVGAVGSLFADGDYVSAVWFTDEQAAREGERRQPPHELQEEIEELRTLTTGQPEFFDLVNPWVHASTYGSVG
jgi:hypothetical protein